MTYAGRLKQPYPESLNVWFADYPEKITMVCGPEFANLSGGTLSPGSRVVLTQTPNSQIPQGEYSSGQALPEVKAIYTDTGSDDTYSVRLTFYGWGTFFSQAEPNYWLEIAHGMTIEAPGMGAEKDFRMWDYHYTGIPHTETVELVEMDNPEEGTTHVSRDEPRPTGTSGSGSGGWIAPTSFGTDQSMWGQWIIELLGLSARTRLSITATPAPYSGAVTAGRLAGTVNGCFMGVLCKIYIVSPQRIVAAFYANQLSSGQVVQEWIAAYYWDTIKADGVDITWQVRRAI